ncbi:hypothetical protein BDV06DRAFT_172624 [Aspergillus oleicola]
MRSLSIIWLGIVTPVLLFAPWALGEPVQYCRFGREEKPDATVDFCLGITTYYNTSSESHDMYMSLQITRSSALGWTAVGTGSMMAGSLMFIIYGDPFSSGHEPPTVSIRTIDGHHQPKIISEVDTGGAGLHLLQAEWVAVNSTDASGRSKGSKRDSLFIAKAAIVCYSCGKWAGSPIFADAKAQPWIWAWNDKQEFDEYPDDVHLKIHERHAEDGGWGRFYVDMLRSSSKGPSPPSIPLIQPGVTALGVSDIPGGWSWMSPAVHIHGFLMSAAFLILYPAGVFAMRSRSPKSFTYHWTLQLIASIFILIGMGIGLLRAHKIDSLHHFIGLTVVVCSIIQIALGWRHHIFFVQTLKRQWASHGHIWLGRIFLFLGWTNVITGLLLTGHGWSLISLTASFISVVALALIGWVWFATRQRKQRELRSDWEDDDSAFALQPTRDDYFAVAADDDEHGSRSSSDNSTPVKISKADAE